MPDFIHVHNIKIPYEIIRSKRKTYGIQIKPGGMVTVRIPLDGNISFAKSMLEEKKEWLYKSFLKMKNRPALTSSQSKSDYEKRLEAPYRKAAKEYIKKRVDYYASILEVTYGTVSIRDQKTRWGSCSSSGNLNFNWRLILAPPKVLDYVVIHELCHRKEMNHSANFWHLVKQVMPDYEEHRKWLKEKGSSLSLMKND